MTIGTMPPVVVHPYSASSHIDACMHPPHLACVHAQSFGKSIAAMELMEDRLLETVS